MNYKRILPIILSASMLFSATGCELFAKNEPEEPDKVITISVTKDMLLEQTKEEVVVKSKDELYSIGQVFEYGSTSFVEFIPGQKLIEENAAEVCLVKFKDTGYMDAILKAKDEIYVSADITNIISGKTSASFKTIYDALAPTGGQYSDLFNRIAEDKERKTRIGKEEIVEEPIIVTIPENELVAEGEDIEEVAEGEVTETETETETEDTTETQEVVEDTTDGVIQDDTTFTTPQTTEEAEAKAAQSLAEILKQYETSVNAGKVYYTQSQLQDIVYDYCDFMNFSLASNLEFYTSSGEYLGPYTSSQLNAYMCKMTGENASYPLISGYAKVSGLLADVPYEINAIDNGNGQFTFHIKNDTNRPVLVSISPKDNPEKVTRIPFLTDSFSITGYYPENEYTVADIYTTYVVSYLFYDTNKDLAYEFAGEPTTVKLSTVQPDDKGKYEFPSEYNIIINDTANNIQITSNSGEKEILKSDTVIAVHPEMYKSFKFKVYEDEIEEEE